MPLTEAQIQRYARHVLLPDVGGRGQARLLDAVVAVEVGHGRGADIAAMAYMAAAGVGRIELVGDVDAPVTADEVATGILYAANDEGRPRAAALAERIGAINPDVEVTDADSGLGHLVSPAPADDVATTLIHGGAAASELVAAIARGRV